MRRLHSDLTVATLKERFDTTLREARASVPRYMPFGEPPWAGVGRLRAVMRASRARSFESTDVLPIVCGNRFRDRVYLQVVKVVAGASIGTTIGWMTVVRFREGRGGTEIEIGRGLHPAALVLFTMFEVAVLFLYGLSIRAISVSQTTGVQRALFLLALLAGVTGPFLMVWLGKWLSRADESFIVDWVRKVAAPAPASGV